MKTVQEDSKVMQPTALKLCKKNDSYKVLPKQMVLDAFVQFERFLIENY